MKKALFVIMSVIIASSFIGCGNKTAKVYGSNDSIDSINAESFDTVIYNAGDSASVDSICLE